MPFLSNLRNGFFFGLRYEFLNVQRNKKTTVESHYLVKIFKIRNSKRKFDNFFLYKLKISYKVKKNWCYNLLICIKRCNRYLKDFFFENLRNQVKILKKLGKGLARLRNMTSEEMGNMRNSSLVDKPIPSVCTL